MDKFEEILTEYRNSRFLVVDPMGGKGDIIIYKGMEKKLKELGIKFTRLQYREERARLGAINHLRFLSYLSLNSQKGIQNKVYQLSKMMLMAEMSRIADFKVVLIRGGAFLNDVWGNYDILENVARNNPDVIIIGPHSFFFKSSRFQDFIKNLHQEIYIFCRENYSYDLLSSLRLQKNVHIYRAGDTALYLSKEDFWPTNEYYSKYGIYDLICNRMDRELLVDWNLGMFKSEKNSFKVSDKKYKFIIGDIAQNLALKDIVNLIWCARRVFTDRLHVGIISAILGKELYLYPNFYNKNKGVYEFSLKRFSNARFVDSCKFEPKDLLG
jgi:exopolysaccharide biosynthesis predicted pyruvyltransferase EpsI